MNESYIESAVRTEASPVDNYKISARVTNSAVLRLLHAGMGLTTEAGEFVDALKRHIFYDVPMDTDNLIEEMGDVMWYLAVAADTLGVTFGEIQARNIAKLRARYPAKFDNDLAVNRDLAAEEEAQTRRL